MQIQKGLSIVTAILFFISCGKSSGGSQNNRVFQKNLLLTSVYAVDSTGYYSTKDSFSYDQSGYLAKLYHYYYDNSNAVVNTAIYTFSINKSDSLISLVTDSLDYYGERTQYTFNLKYDGQNRLIKLLPTNPLVNAIQYSYFTNGITYQFPPDAMYADSLVLMNGNVAHWYGSSVSSGANNFVCNFNYSAYPNPYYSDYFANFGGLFWTLTFPDLGRENGYLFDGLSRNVPDSMHYSDFYTGQTGAVRYTWTMDSIGRVVSGTRISTDSGINQGGVPVSSYFKVSLKFNYAQ